MAENENKRVLVTGGNGGIGYSMCKLLALNHGCHVYMGSRSAERGASALEKMISEDAGCQGKVEVVTVDVADAASITACAATMAEKLGDQKLYALVNNAGTAEWVGDGVARDAMIATNCYGAKLMMDAFQPLIDGRIVNVSSGMGPSYVSKLPEEERPFWSSQQLTWEELEPAFKAQYEKIGADDKVAAYSFTKTILNKVTEIAAKDFPAILISSCSPGYVETGMNPEAGASGGKTSEEGCVSSIKCLFDELPGSGFFYGSDGVRGPLHYSRDPGTPAFEGY